MFIGFKNHDDHKNPENDYCNEVQKKGDLYFGCTTNLTSVGPDGKGPDEGADYFGIRIWVRVFDSMDLAEQTTQKHESGLSGIIPKNSSGYQSPDREGVLKVSSELFSEL